MSSLGILDEMTCYLENLHYFKEKIAYKYVGYVKQYNLVLLGPLAIYTVRTHEKCQRNVNFIV